MMEKIDESILSRRQFLQLSILAGAGAVTGCAVNPVTGKNQLMMVSEQTEIQIDKQQSPHQFSADYGAIQDGKLNTYIDGIGKKLAGKTHRPHMPYSFRCVNATYVNAYAFPGGSIAVTRGILLKLKNEAELAALLGHELGHVNARHSAEQISKSNLSSVLIGGLSAVIGTRSSQLGEMAQQIGMIGQGMLLARYSRDNEREADGLGNEYMVNAGYSTDGFTGLMDLLNTMNKSHNSSAEMLFSTHPMSSERYETAVRMAQSKYQASRSFSLNRERYMDHTAKLRSKEKLITRLQDADVLMAEKKYKDAEKTYKSALHVDSSDYAGNIMLAKCLLVQKDYAGAGQYARKAADIYPGEGQARHVAGFAFLQQKKYDAAYQNFVTYDQLLPGNPGTVFFKGYCLEKMDRVPQSAGQYQQYLKQVQQGQYAEHAFKKLQEWGYIKN